MEKIKNADVLAVTPLRRSALRIAEAGLQAIDTESVIKKLVRFEGSTLSIAGETFDRNALGRVVVAGAGKCSLAAARALEDILGDNISSGAVLDLRSDPSLSRIKSFRGTHPLPSEENVRGAGEIVELLKDLKENDLVIFVISGGGSALLCLPEGVGCEEEGRIWKFLTHAGATIQEINTVRKHLSLARGGHLARYAYPARVVSLIFSDVPGNDIEFVASGPTMKDTTSVRDAAAILEKYDILRTCGIENCGLVETPKEDKYFARVKNIVAVSNTVALDAMKREAEDAGFAAEICDAYMSGEAREVGEKIIRKLHGAAGKTALLYGGETTVKIAHHDQGHGHGGRSVELAISALRFVEDGELILPFASDGRDNGEFAGAICDTITKNRSGEFGVDVITHLDQHDGYQFFEKVGNYLMTDDTGSNVSDLVIALKD